MPPSPIRRSPYNGPVIDVVPRRPYFQRRGWKDLIFFCIVIILGAFAQRYYLRPYLMSDYDKWKVRPHLVRRISLDPLKPGQTGLPPCLFLASPKVVNPAIASGTIADCLQLRPNGQPFNLYEVDLLHGLVIPVTTDLYVADGVMPLAFTRSYYPLYDWSERFQVFLPNVYNLFLTGHRNPYTDAQWSLPDNQIVHLDRISSGSVYADAVFESASAGPDFAGARQNWNGDGWDFTLPDGTTFLSPEAYNSTRPQEGSIVGIFDSQGHEIHLVRQKNGDLTEIDSPGGRWIKLHYDGARIAQAEDSTGKSVGYTYDYANRPATVVYGAGNSIGYSYDSANRLTGVQDFAAGLILEDHYDLSGLLESVAIGAGQKYQFRYSVEQSSKILDLDITDPGGTAQRLSIQVLEGKSFYTIQPLSPAAQKADHP